MPTVTTFPTGRTRSLTVNGSLFARFAHYRDSAAPHNYQTITPNPSLIWQGAAASASLSFVILRNGVPPPPSPEPPQPTDTFGAALTLTVGVVTQTFYYDSGIPISDENYDFSVSVNLTVTGPVREMKRVTVYDDYPGNIVDFTPRTQLDYYEQWNGVVTLTASGAVSGSVSDTLSSDLFWPDGYQLDLHASYHENCHVQIPPWTRPFSGEFARVTAEGIAGMPLEHTTGTEVVGDKYTGEVGKQDSVSVARVSDNPLTITTDYTTEWPLPIVYDAIAHLSAVPAIQWSLEGHVHQWTEGYGGAQVDDLSKGDVLTANAQGDLTRSYTARSFNWSIATLADSASDTMNGYRLNAGWIAANGEVTDDWRTVLEDDRFFDSFTLSHAASLVLEDFTSTAGWLVTPANGANLSIENGLKAEVTAEDVKISKSVEKRLTHYRYLRLRLKANADAVPVRVWMGERYWDVLVETADTVEEKIIDLCAAHNAVSFDDIKGVDNIETIAFDGLPSGVTYWFSDLTLVRLPSPPPQPPPEPPPPPPVAATALAAFQDDYRILTVEVNDKISLKLAYGGSLNDLINTITTQGSGWGYTITSVSSTHDYYNNDLYAAYLVDIFDADLTQAVTFRALPRYDRITVYPGIGDPTQGYGIGSFIVRFTKRLHGRIDGLVYIRDLYPSGTITTKIEARKGGQTQDEQRTDERRYHRTKHLKAGTHEIVDVIRTGDTVYYETKLGDVAVVNRKVGRGDGRARVWDKVTETGIGGADLTAQRSDACGFGVGTSTENGLYAIAPMYPCLCPPSNTYDITADAEDYTQKSFKDITVPEGWIVDIDFPLGYSGAVSGSVTDADTQSPIGEAAVIAEQSEEPYTGTGNEISDAGGNYTVYDLDTPSAGSSNAALYDIHADDLGHSVASQFGVSVGVHSAKHQITAQADFILEKTGRIEGLVTDDGGTPIFGAIVVAQQSDGLFTGLHETETSADGSYAIENIDVPGDYSVRLEAVGYERRSQQVSVSDANPVTVNFQTVPATRIEGSVLASGTQEPVVGATVYASGSLGEAWASTDVSGQYVMDDLPGAGTYEVTVYADGWNSPPPQTVTVQAGQSAIANFILTPSL